MMEEEDARESTIKDQNKNVLEVKKKKCFSLVRKRDIVTSSPTLLILPLARLFFPSNPRL